MKTLYTFFPIVMIFLLFNKEAQGVLTAANINNRLATTRGRPHSDSIRQKESFAFKRFIETTGESTQNARRAAAIQSLRTILRPAPGFAGYINRDITRLETDLRENPITFLRKRLARSEVKFQNTIASTPMAPLVGELRIGLGSASGTLFAVPDLTGGFAFHVLTCGHVLESIPRSFSGRVQASFHLPQLGVIAGINLVKVFRPPLGTVRIQHIFQGNNVDFPDNTALFQDVRALPNYDGSGDVAVLSLDPASHGALLAASQIQNVRFAPVADGSLAVSFTRPNPPGPDVQYIIRFISTLAQAQNLAASINEAEGRNYILGYPGFSNQALKKTKKRTIYPTIPNSFIHTPSLTVNQFYHDAPVYWGMSGGPIFNVAGNTVNIYGVVSRIAPYNNINPNNNHPAWSSQNIGAFLRVEVLP